MIHLSVILLILGSNTTLGKMNLAKYPIRQDANTYQCICISGVPTYQYLNLLLSFIKYHGHTHLMIHICNTKNNLGQSLGTRFNLSTSTITYDFHYYAVLIFPEWQEKFLFNWSKAKMKPNIILLIRLQALWFYCFLECGAILCFSLYFISQTVGQINMKPVMRMTQY